MINLLPESLIQWFFHSSQSGNKESQEQARQNTTAGGNAGAD